MTIEETLNQKFKEALKARDQATLDVIRMVRTEMKRALKSGPHSGEAGDELWAEAIQGYVKRMRKALPEYEEAGERGEEMARKLRFEIEFLDPFLPKLLDEAGTERIVLETIKKLSADSPKMAGRVVGAIVKEYKGRVDPALVKKLAERLLGEGGGQ